MFRGMGRPRKAAEYRLWQHPNGTWYVLWTAPGGTKRLSTRTTDKRKARKWLDQFQAGLETPKPPVQLTIDAILDGYLADRKPRVRAYDTLEWACKALRREIGNLEPGHLSNSVMRKFAKTRQLQGRANGTIIREIVTLRAALKWAKAEDWIEDVPDLPMPVSAPPPRDRWLTKDEVRKLLANAMAFHIKLF